MTKSFAIIVAGGQSTRFNDGIQSPDNTVPKQFLPLGLNKRVIDHAIERLSPIVDKVLVVVPAGYEEEIKAPLHTITGGQTRTESVYKGLSYLNDHLKAKEDSIILIHDAARPYPSLKSTKEMLKQLKSVKCLSATLALPMADTLIRDEDFDYVPRHGLHNIQTPQGFHFGKIYKAHQKAAKENLEFTDDTALFKHFFDIAPKLFEGTHNNFKITYKHDYERAKQMIEPHYIPRIGQGFDVHAFEKTPSESGVCRLGGIDIPHGHKLKGHSDADVVLHAITDALLGALTLGDIGQHFPPSDQSFKDIDSAVFLKKACQLLRNERAKISNIDLTIICETPKIGPHIQAMQERIAGICEIDTGQVSIKATTTEKLGFTGRKEGIAVQASACILCIALGGLDV